MPTTPVHQDRIIVCDCFTIFAGHVGGAERPDSILLTVLLESLPGRYLGLTTEAEWARSREFVVAHAEKRPEKFPQGAAEWALDQLDRLADGEYQNFQVRRHPTVSQVASDDHVVLLSAAAEWNAGFMTARNYDLLGIREFRGVKLRRPAEILRELPDTDDLAGP